MVAASVPVDIHGLLTLVFDVVVIGLIVIKPLSRNYDDSDRGSGSVVLMDPPLRPSYARCATFLLVSFLTSAAIIELRTPDLVVAYHGLVAQLMNSAVRQPQSVGAYSRSLLPVFQISVVSFGLAFAVAFRASVARRVVILLNVVLFLAASAVVDAVLGAVLMATGLPLAPAPAAALVLEYTVAGFLVIRLVFTSFQLPRKTQLPLRRGNDWKNDLVLVSCIAASAAVTTLGAVFVVSRFGSDPLVVVLVLLAFQPYVILLINVFLGLVGLVRRKRVYPGSERPPIDVIIPAFNEELDIAPLLRSIDEAAVRYGGPVKIYLCDDGSVDETLPLATETMAAFKAATGEILLGSHSGKSGALNRGLARCTADYVVRVDADCRVHPDCLLYSIPHFLASPDVGLVGAFTLPKEPYTTWIDRLRLFEMVVSFGFIRPTSDIVDGVFCVPGTYTAFRRQAALEIGGFTEGMYGEDVDFTYAMTRIGYRAVNDVRVRSYEDVPNTQRQLRTQRTRWNRGGTMAFARFVPVATGLSGPRHWFFASRAAVKRFLAPLHFASLTYLLAVSLLHPTLHINLARVGFVMLIRAVPPAIELVACCIWYGTWRQLAWLPMQYGFVILRHYYCLECLLSFNARPVLTRRMADALRRAKPPRLLVDVTE